MGQHPSVVAMFERKGAAKAVEAVVERRPDPACASRTIITITGRTSEAVQRQINKLMLEVEETGGFANFIGPAWLRDRRGYSATGEMIVGPWI